MKALFKWCEEFKEGINPILGTAANPQYSSARDTQYVSLKRVTEDDLIGFQNFSDAG